MSKVDIEPTKEQQTAIQHFKGPMLVVAGPGSGKTEVLLRRIEYLIKEKKVKPSSILACTFTNKATENIKFRLARLIGTKSEEVYISTIHAFCRQMLREYPDYHKIGENFDVLDGEAQSMLIRAIYWGPLMLVRSGLIRKKDGLESLIELFNIFSRNLVDTEKLRNYYESNGDYDDLKRRFLRAYDLYTKYLRDKKKIDFSYLQRYFFETISSRKKFLETLQDRFLFALVDEFQDVSPIQFKIIRKIFETKGRTNIFAVGDDDQSIYGWRGTDNEIFSRFTKTFRDCSMVKLENNFRSSAHIVESANDYIAENSKIKKKLKTARDYGNRIVLIKGEDCKNSAKLTTDFIKELKTKNIVNSYGDIVLLFRSVKYHATEYIESLESTNLPYVVYGRGSLLSRDDIKSIVYFMSYLTQEAYSDNSFKQWRNWWDVGQFASEFLALTSKTKGILLNAEQNLNICELKNRNDCISLGIKSEEDIIKILSLNQHREDILKKQKEKKKTGVLRIFYDVLDASGYLSRLLHAITSNTENEENLYNTARLSQIISSYSRSYNMHDIKGLIWYLYSSNLNRTFDEVFIENPDSIKIMTIHQAKGLEFPAVIIGSLINGRFPSDRKSGKLLIDIPENLFLRNKPYNEQEEQRRLFYVGITRAQDLLTLITSEKINIQKKGISPFIEDLGSDNLCCKDEVSKSCASRYQIAQKSVYISFSALDTYIMCPYLYKLHYDYGFETPATFFQNYGLILHTALMRINKALQKGQDIDLTAIIDNSWMPLPIADKREGDIRKEFQRILEKYIETFTNKFKEIIVIEEPFTVIGDEYIIAGKVDLIFCDFDDTINLVDFKARYSAGIEKTNVKEQLQLYNYCLKQKYKIDKLFAYTLLDNKEYEVLYEESNIKKILSDFRNSILYQEYERNVSHCPDCFFNFCCGELK